MGSFPESYTDPKNQTNFIRERQEQAGSSLAGNLPLKLEKDGPAFSNFNPCPSLSSVARDDRLFENIANSMTLAPLSLKIIYA